MPFTPCQNLSSPNWHSFTSVELHGSQLHAAIIQCKIIPSKYCKDWVFQLDQCFCMTFQNSMWSSPFSYSCVCSFSSDLPTFSAVSQRNTFHLSSAYLQYKLRNIAYTGGGCALHTWQHLKYCQNIWHWTLIYHKSITFPKIHMYFNSITFDLIQLLSTFQMHLLLRVTQKSTGKTAFATLVQAPPKWHQKRNSK